MFPSPQGRSVDGLDLVQVLCRQPRLLRVPEHSCLVISRRLFPSGPLKPSRTFLSHVYLTIVIILFDQSCWVKIVFLASFLPCNRDQKELMCALLSFKVAFLESGDLKHILRQGFVRCRCCWEVPVEHGTEKSPGISWKWPCFSFLCVGTLVFLMAEKVTGLKMLMSKLFWSITPFPWTKSILLEKKITLL